MSVRLRLRRMGSRKRPFYRIVAADSRYQRDGRFLEVLGYYDPKPKDFKFKVDREKVFEWLRKGAQMSNTVEGLLRREGIVQEYNISKEKSSSKSKKNEEKNSEFEAETQIAGEA